MIQKCLFNSGFTDKAGGFQQQETSHEIYNAFKSQRLSNNTWTAGCSWCITLTYTLLKYKN